MDQGFDNTLNQIQENPLLAESLSQVMPQGEDKSGNSLAILDRTIAYLDKLIDDFINRVLHHPKFQRLEAAYRSIQWLCQTVVQEDDRVRISVFDISSAELAEDLAVSDLHRGSRIYQKLYYNRFATPFGHAELGDPKAVGYPFGLIIVDFELSIHDGQDRERSNSIDVRSLARLSNLAADCFCPVICGVGPSVFGIRDFSDLEASKRVFEEVFLHKDRKSQVLWDMFRKSDDAKYVGLVVPRILIREPYDGVKEYFVEKTRPDGTPFLLDKSFAFHEQIGKDRGKLLWASGAYALASLAGRAFRNTGWFADLRGFELSSLHEGGLVSELLKVSSRTDAQGVAPICPTELMISEDDDALLSQYGFICLYTCQHTGMCSVLSCQSPVLRRAIHSDSFQLSTMLNYVLCVCRLGHVLKRRLTQKIGSTQERNELERDLDQLVKQFVTQSPSIRLRKEKPLSAAKVLVKNDPDDPGVYFCDFEFAPHFQFDNVEATISLRTSVRKGI